MKKNLSVRLFCIALLFSTQSVHACTAFGAITKSGTIISKNRDYYYIPQQFGKILPTSEFYHWYDNPYRHNNFFYGITYAGSVSMGVNQKGLTAIEEDAFSPGHPENVTQYKTLQHRSGMPDGMVLRGVLQNFNSVDEIIPYAPAIFSAAAPDFYQLADAKKILTVEVAPASGSNTKNSFRLNIISKPGDYFTHTNSYLQPDFISLNNLVENKNSMNGSNNRLQTITDFVSHTEERDIDQASLWFKNTTSHVSNTPDPNGCRNTSLFRSDLQGFTSVDEKNQSNGKIFGTVANMIVDNKGSLEKSDFYLMMLDSVTTENNGDQVIKYDELHTTLAKLFDETSSPVFISRSFIRKAPYKGLCS